MSMLLEAPPGVDWNTDAGDFLASLDDLVQRRPYQEAAFRGVFDRFAAGDRSTLVVQPTGTGKTVVFGLVTLFVTGRLGGRVLILAHRGELIQQAAAKLDGIGVETVVEQADQDAREAIDAARHDLIHPREIRCVVASVQTLHERRLPRWPRDYFDLIVIDEAHHSVADTYRRILDHFDAARVLGVTATADRLDGSNLGDVFSSVAAEYRLDDAIRDGWLCRLEAVKADVRVDLRGIRTTGGDFNAGDMEDRISAHLEPLVNATREKIGTRRTIAFTPDCGSAANFAAGLRALGIDARDINGKSADRDRILRDFADGVFQVLVNCALLLEGYDNPGIAAVVLARPTKSRALLAQMVGRGTRLHPGKSECLVVDFDWQLDRHQLVRPVDLLAPDGVSARRSRIARELVESGDAADLADAFEYAAEIETLELAKEAEARAEAERARLAIRERPTNLAWTHFDPVKATPSADVIGLSVPESFASRKVPATDKQRAALVRFGLPESEVAAMSRRAASAHIDALIARRDRGLATYKQVKLMVKHGIPAAEARVLPFADASKLIDNLIRQPRRAM